MVPPEEGLGARETAIHVELRLVVHLKLAVLHGLAQALLQLLAFQGELVQRRREALETVAATLLGAVHGGLGVGQEGGGIHTILGMDTDADAGAELKSPIAGLEGRAEGIQQLLAHLRGAQVLLQLRQQHQEAASAHARKGVVLAHRHLQAARHLAQHLVATGMPHQLIDTLEAVKVQRPGRPP